MSEVLVTPTLVSATTFMRDQPHFVAWTVQGSGWTATACFPMRRQPFDFSRILGIIDNKGVFQSIDCADVCYEGSPLQSVQIQPDREATSHARNSTPAERQMIVDDASR